MTKKKQNHLRRAGVVGDHQDEQSSQFDGPSGRTRADVSRRGVLRAGATIGATGGLSHVLSGAAAGSTIGTDDGGSRYGPTIEPDDEQVSVPFGLSTGGFHDNGYSQRPVEKDGVEYEPAVDPNTIDGVAAAAWGGVNDALQGDPVRPYQEWDHDPLYQTENWGKDLSFAVTLENGTYDVTLNFAEIFHDSKGLRVFDVAVQGETVLWDFDIYAEAELVDGVGGDHAAVDRTFEGIEVTDGVLWISTFSKTDDTKFSGFAIQEAE